MVAQIRLAYYCSGHGYGHATRVSAFASTLLSLEDKPDIHVVSSAPMHVFFECIERGAHYRYAEVDPIISQPLAYKVDRQRSVQVLQTFLSEKEDKLAFEAAWLSSARIDCVLSDSAFLACEAATMARIPSMLITNFTFDSVYSYLGTEISDAALSLGSNLIQKSDQTTSTFDDTPVPLDVLEPLVLQLLAGYRHADTLLLLPGFIPIPSFFPSPALPATAWVDPSTNRFRPEIESILLELSTSELCPLISSPLCTSTADPDTLICDLSSRREPFRTVKFAPLLVRQASPGINTREGKLKLLKSIGIPEALCESDQTRILVVSFGGQTIRRPYSGKNPSRTPLSPEEVNDPVSDQTSSSKPNLLLASEPRNDTRQSLTDAIRPITTFSRRGSTKLFIPGAPAPANNPASPRSPVSPNTFGPNVSCPAHIEPVDVRSLSLNAATLSANSTITLATCQEQGELILLPSLLPSPSWIAIICGVPSNWSLSGDEEEELPPAFYTAPRDVYMPDLTAIADVVLGKLGYGTVSECVAHSTPFVYVPRPLFVEEHGLRLLLEAEGTGVELSRHEYESGQWAKKVDEAYHKGQRLRQAKDHDKNKRDVIKLARWVVETVRALQAR